MADQPDLGSASGIFGGVGVHRRVSLSVKGIPSDDSTTAFEAVPVRGLLAKRHRDGASVLLASSAVYFVHRLGARRIDTRSNPPRFPWNPPKKRPKPAMSGQFRRSGR
jgi:hypothetical protein